MKSHLRHTISKAWLALCAAACASAPSPDRDAASNEVVKQPISPQETLELTRQTTIHTHEFRAAPQKVWGALLSAGTDLGLQLQSTDSSTGVAVFYLAASGGRIAGRPASTWLDCGRAPGGVPRTETYQITIRLTGVVEPGAAGGTRLRTSMVAYARDRGMGGAGLPCTSAGTLENHLVAATGEKLRS